MRALILILFSTLNLFSSALLAQTTRVRGKVTDEKAQPLSFATVTLLNSNTSVYTDEKGEFSFDIPSNTESTGIRVSMVGMQTLTRHIPARELIILQVFVLKEQNLSLDEVKVWAERSNQSASNSSIVFDREAIEQVQAFSITDVLNNLPGKAMKPLDLQGPQNMILRSTARPGENVARNNAMGTAIIVDGIRQNNDANMQSKNLGTYGMGGALISDYQNTQKYDVTFGGLDLREIAADNIESIEVITGVASARYGDLTDGAVIINRQAGKTPLTFSTRINAGSTNFSLSKGFPLKGKLGALNTNINYLYSNDDPTDNMKMYSRLSGGLMWTTRILPSLKNTFSLDFRTKFDDAKQDPDDGRELLAYSKNNQFNVSNRSLLDINHSIFKKASLVMGLNLTRSESYSQWWLNRAPEGVADKDTTGVYEGFYIPGNFLAVDHIQGRPINFNSNLSVDAQLRTGKITHFLSSGTSLSYSSNKGNGVLFDSQRPRFSNQGNKNERPYNFQIVPDLVNFGVYAEDRFGFNFLNREVNVNAGLRFDSQNSHFSWQPRINANYKLGKNLSMNMAYGVATKAPTMAYRYPGPTYFDIPLINYYTGDVRESLLLVYTEKYIPDNSDLKPSRSEQAEFGFSYSGKMLNTSVFGYVKNQTDGFNTQSIYKLIAVPEYKYNAIPGQKPTYWPTGNYSIKPGLTVSEVMNNVTSDSYGVEWLLSTARIKAISTSIGFNTVYSYSKYQNAGITMIQASDNDILANKRAWYGLYESLNQANHSLVSRLNTDTHFPKLGFVLSLIYDITWKERERSLNPGRLPFAWLDKDYNVYAIDVFDSNNPDYGHLKPTSGVANTIDSPFPWGNISMRLAKEVRKKYRFSLSAYNFLNVRQRYYDLENKKQYTFQQPISVGAEITIKL